VDDAANAVGVPLLRHDQARVPRVDRLPQRGLGRLGYVDGHHRRDRRHHLSRLLLVQVEDAREHPRLARVQLPAALAARDDQLQVLGRADVLELRARVNADQPEDPVRSRVERPDQGVEDTPEQLERTRHAHQRLLGVDDRVDLRHLLAEGDVEGGRDQVGERERDRQRRAVRDRRAERILEQLRDRGLAEEPDAQRGHRDPQLARGQVFVDALDLLEDERGTSASLVAELLDPSLRRAHERELGGDEDAVQSNQNGYAEQEQDLGHLRPLSCWGRTVRSFVCLLRGGSSSLMR
jgi:hypothetical protein